MKTKLKNAPSKVTKCPFCDYSNLYVPAVINHIKGNHIGKWKGSWAATIGQEPQMSLARSGRIKSYAAKRREANIMRGLTSSGKPRKMRLRKSYRGPRPGITATLIRTPEHIEALAKKRAYNAKLRQKNLAKGLTTTGKVRKRPLSESIVKRYPALTNGQVDTILEQPTGPVRGHIDHCPNCGENIKAYEEAKGLRDWLKETGKI